jgi:hypothetical protein
MSAATYRLYEIIIKDIPCNCQFNFRLNFSDDGFPVNGLPNERANYTELTEAFAMGKKARMKVLESDGHTFPLYFNIKGVFDLVIHYTPSTNSWAAAETIFRNGRHHTIYNMDVTEENYDDESWVMPQQHVLETVNVEYLELSYDEGRPEDEEPEDEEHEDVAE